MCLRQSTENDLTPQILFKYLGLNIPLSILKPFKTIQHYINTSQKDRIINKLIMRIMVNEVS